LKWGFPASASINEVDELGVVTLFCHGHDVPFKGKGVWFHQCHTVFNADH
jgi:hypothetical protein